MLLNRVETLLMNNPVRELVQRHHEVPQLLRLGGSMPRPGVALEIGCGRGVGIDCILDSFGAGSVDAFDLDPRMVRRARARQAHRGNRVRIWAGDATRVEAPDDHYDAAFDFGIVHHIPAWREALCEVHRVLKPGGRFYAEEMYREFVTHPFWRRVLDHPQGDRFDHEQFSEGMREAGLRVVAERRGLYHYGWIVAEKPGGVRGGIDR
jgi:ubiquinone/menaquinone biosynthesis C-methylase UbiE